MYLASSAQSSPGRIPDSPRIQRKVLNGSRAARKIFTTSSSEYGSTSERSHAGRIRLEKGLCAMYPQPFEYTDLPRPTPLDEPYLGRLRPWKSGPAPAPVAPYSYDAWAEQIAIPVRTAIVVKSRSTGRATPKMDRQLGPRCCEAPAKSKVRTKAEA